MRPTTADRLAELDDRTRALVLELLDEITRPLDRRELEKALGRCGITRAARPDIVEHFLTLEIVVLCRPDG